VAGVPALKLSFLVSEIPREEYIKNGDDEVLDLGKLKLGLLNEIQNFKYTQLGNHATVDLT